jgi:hypothetical protein
VAKEALAADSYPSQSKWSLPIQCNGVSVTTPLTKTNFFAQTARWWI